MTSTMTETQTETQVFRIYINAPAQKVWDALTSSELAQQYGYGTPVDVDLTPGGHCRHLTTDEMKQMGLGDVAAEGEVVEVDPPNRLVITWNPCWNDEPATRITYDIVSSPGHATSLTLTHTLAGAPTTAAEVAGGGDPEQGGGGWPWVLSGLKTFLETGQPMP